MNDRTIQLQCGHRFPVHGLPRPSRRSAFKRARAHYYNHEQHRYDPDYVRLERYRVVIDADPGQMTVTARTQTVVTDPKGKPRPVITERPVTIPDVPSDVAAYVFTIKSENGAFGVEKTNRIRYERIPHAVDGDVAQVAGRPFEQTVFLPSPGSYEITVEQRREDGSVRVGRRRRLYLEDRLVVSLGDAYASGEGCPDVPGEPANITDAIEKNLVTLKISTGGSIATDPAPLWLEKEAHRSLWSGHAQAARDQEDPATGRLVTFLTFARARDTVREMVAEGGGPAWARGMSQVDEMLATLERAGRRRIHALIVSAGGNDVGFARGVEQLVTEGMPLFGAGDTPENRGRIEARVAAAIDTLDSGFAVLKARLDASPFTVDHLFLVEYPTAMFDDATGKPERGSGVFEGSDLALGPEAAHLIKESAQRLNRKLRDIADRHGWIYVGGIASRFSGHGVALGQESYYRSGESSLESQGDTEGMLRPNERGQEVIRRQLGKALEAHLSRSAQGATRPGAVRAGHVPNVRERWEQALFSDPFGEPPVVLAAMTTAHGTETASVRIRNVTPEGFEMRVEETRSEARHLTPERVAYMAFEKGPIQTLNGAVIGYAGITEAMQPDRATWRRVGIPSWLQGEVVAVFQPNSAVGADPVHARLGGISNGGEHTSRAAFFRLEEWPGLEGAHRPEQVAYVVARTGVHDLGLVGTLSAGLVERVGADWCAMSLWPRLNGKLSVTAAVQSFNGADPVVPRLRPARGNGYDVRLQEEGGSIHADEQVGFLALGETR